MHTAPTSLDSVAGIIVALIFLVSSLTLLGMALLMAIGAIFSNRPLVTSWSPDQEHAFTSFEQRGSASNSRAWTASLIAAIGLGIFAIAVYFGVAPEHKDISKDMNMSNLTKKRPSAAPKAETPAPAAETPAPAEPSAPAEAPKP